MNIREQLVAHDVDVSRHDYEDSTVLAADFGYVESASVDVVDDTVIVVADDEQYDIEVDGDAQAFMQNGILTIEVSA